MRSALKTSAKPPPLAEEITLGAQVGQHGRRRRGRMPARKSAATTANGQSIWPAARSQLRHDAAPAQAYQPPQPGAGPSKMIRNEAKVSSAQAWASKKRAANPALRRRARRVRRPSHAQQIEHCKGNPLAAGDVELAQGGVEEFGRGKGIDDAGRRGDDIEHTAVGCGDRRVRGGKPRPPPELQLVEHEQKRAIPGQDEGRRAGGCCSQPPAPRPVGAECSATR